MTAAGNDTDQAFLVAEINGDEMCVQRHLARRARSSTPA